MNIILFVLLISVSFSQVWKKMESSHAIIEYPSEMESTATKLLSQTEAILPRLSKISNYSLDHFKAKKVDIYLTNAPDITNGFAIGNVVTIYARSSHFLPRWSSNVDWYQRVLAHELVHHIMFRKVVRTPSIFGLGVNHVLGRPPRWFSEGFAQYLAEEWDYFRGDYRLQRSILNGSLSYGRMMADMSLTYPAGHAFIRYLADQFGDEKLNELMEYGQPSWVYDFNKAFYETYKSSPSELFQTFRKSLVIFYGNKLHDIPTRNDSINLFSHGFHTSQIIPLNTKDSTYVVSSQLSPNDRYITSYVYSTKRNPKKTLYVSEKVSTPISISENDQFIAYGKLSSYSERNEDFIRFNWYVYDINLEREIQLKKSVRSRYSAIYQNKYLLLSVVNHDHSKVIKIDIITGEEETLLEVNEAIGKITTKNNNIYLEYQNKAGKRGIYYLKDNSLKAIVNSEFDDRNPLIINDSLMFFNRIEDERFTVFRYENGIAKRVIYDQKDYVIEKFNATTNSILFSLTSDFGKKQYISVSVDSLQNEVKRPVFENGKYGSWRLKQTEVESILSIPDTIIESTVTEQPYPQFGLQNFATGLSPIYKEQWGLGLTTTWAEPLKRQYVSLNGLLFKDWDESIMVLKHHLKTNGIMLNSLYYHAPSVFKYHDHQEDLSYSIFEMNISKNLRLFNNNWMSLKPYVGLNYISYNLPTSETRYTASLTGFSFSYEKPSRYLSQKKVVFDVNYLKPISGDEELSILRVKNTVASTLFLRNLNVMNHFSFIQNTGKEPINSFVGVDKYYDFNLRREVGFTESIRGFDGNIASNIVRWNSLNIQMLLLKQSNLKALFLPINNIAVTYFYDYASLDRDVISSNGVELSFGEAFYRVSLGTAHSKLNSVTFSKAKYYLRYTFNL